jgi:hypothetical protein
MNPAGKVRCNMETQIRLANHNCNFYRLKARVLLPSTPVMTHSVCVVANPGPLVRTSPRRVGALTRSAPCLICAGGAYCGPRCSCQGQSRQAHHGVGWDRECLPCLRRAVQVGEAVVDTVVVGTPFPY